MWNPATQPNNNSKTPDPVKAGVVTTPSNFEPPPATGTRGATTNNHQEQATIGKSLVVKGEVTGSESLYVDGRVEGTINLPGNRVTIGRNGQVQADITAREIVVLGAVTGNITASDRVEVRSEGSLTGDVSCQRISIEDGAFFKGGIDVRKPAGKENGHGSKEDATESRLAAALA
jgi:cytoskeletal protein CcmA (bactofilin family)